MKKHSREKGFFKHPLRIGLLFAILVLAIGFGVYLTFFHKSVNQSSSVKKIVSSGTAPSTKQNTSQSTTVPAKTSTNNNSTPTGVAIDTHGQDLTNSNSSQWATSASGQLTVRQPIGNGVLKSGGALSGTAKVSSVNYRLIDNDTGVLANGSLSVTNGSFSGTLQFQPQASGGRLDVFSTEPDGTEINEVQIYVSFK